MALKYYNSIFMLYSRHELKHHNVFDWGWEKQSSSGYDAIQGVLPKIMTVSRYSISAVIEAALDNHHRICQKVSAPPDFDMCWAETMFKKGLGS